MTTPQDRYRDFLETLTQATLDGLRDQVTADVHFKDPFNDVRGADAMRRIFQHMFEAVADVRFQVRHMVTDDDLCLMEWHFEGKLGSRPWLFDGMSLIRFAANGRVAEHIDHWDAAGNFYERLPVIGWLLAALRRRLAIR